MISTPPLPNNDEDYDNEDDDDDDDDDDGGGGWGGPIQGYGQGWDDTITQETK